jgi:hypothetical protein
MKRRPALAAMIRRSGRTTDQDVMSHRQAVTAKLEIPPLPFLMRVECALAPVARIIRRALHG